MDERPELPAVNRRLETVSGSEKLAQSDADSRRLGRSDRSARDDVGQVLPAHVLHRDEVVRRLVTFFELSRDEGARVGKLRLQPGTPPLGVEDFLRFAVFTSRNELQRNLTR